MYGTQILVDSRWRSLIAFKFTNMSAKMEEETGDRQYRLTESV